MEVYILDTNFFITPYRNWYAPDILPAFWDRLAEVVNSVNNIYTIDKVRDELKIGQDWLWDWFRQNFPQGKILSSSFYWRSYPKVVKWVRDQTQDGRFTTAAKDEFLNKGADPFIVACALSFKDSGAMPVVTTQERNDPNCRSKVLIPVVCNDFGISTTNILQFIRTFNIKIT